MSGIISPLAYWGCWAAFIIFSVLGHIGLKHASNIYSSSNIMSAIQASFSCVGIFSWLAWGLSGIFWMMILSKDTLSFANTASALRYLAIALAAWAIFGETISKQQLLGLSLVAAGVWLFCAHS